MRPGGLRQYHRNTSRPSPLHRRAAVDRTSGSMLKTITTIAALALIAPGIADARPAKKTQKAKRATAVVAQSDVPMPPSPATMRVAEWVAASGDNRSLPYAIIDKAAAALFLFDAKGEPLGTAPVLIGIAAGDDATPGVGSKKLGEIGPAEKTTPAGRFLAKFGLAAGKQKVLWVDYANSVAIHPIPADASKTEQRRERMLSPTSDDNRITFGCINVPMALYGKIVRPLFQKRGGYVYVLPDSKPLEVVFPRLRVQALLTGAAL
jgi:hypothetical protein